MTEGYVIECRKTFNKYFDILREHGGMYDDNGNQSMRCISIDVVLIYHNPEINGYNSDLSTRKLKLIYPKGNSMIDGLLLIRDEHLRNDLL